MRLAGLVHRGGSSYATHGVTMIPMFIFYSMPGFQRIEGEQQMIWAALDARAKGFLFGGTAGRTTLAGEGLQHQDGNSHLFAAAYPHVRCYDPAFAYETTIIILEGMREMYARCEDAIYYITIYNESYEMPAMPQGSAEGILSGLYRLGSVEAGSPRVQLFGSGAVLREAQRAQTLLAEKFGVSSDVWSATSYKELRRDAQACRRWNMLHPQEKPRVSYLERTLAGVKGPFVAASDYVRGVPEQINPCDHPADCSRWEPTVSAAATRALRSAGSLKSTPNASPWPPWRDWPRRANSIAPNSPRQSKPSASIPKKSTQRFP